MKTKNSGFSIVELIVVVVVIGLIGAVGYVGYNQFTKSQTANNESSKQASSDDIKNVEDLDATKKQLDDIELADDTQSAEFDTITNKF